MGWIKELFFRWGAFLGPLFFSKSAFAQQTDAGESQVIFSSEITAAKKLIDIIIEFCVKYSFQVLGGIIVFALGCLVANVAAKILSKFMKRHNLDVTVTKFAVGALKLLIIAFAALIALGKFGITIAPFIAGLSVIGFGTSFALQGPLSNYAAGITLVFTKPFKVGDIIEVAGVTGEVEDMTLARTQMVAIDGNKIIIPNKHIIGEVIQNFSGFKKLDITIGVSYGSDLEKAISLIKEVITKDKRISAKPMPKVGISEFADSSINIYARMWCKQADYWEAMFDINKKVFDEFGKNNITIPFPQRDVHLYKET